jgi:hypothetical protein
LTSCLAKKPIPADTVDLSQAGVLYAQPIVNGFQLVNSKKVVMKVKKHLLTCLIAMRESIQGVLISKTISGFVLSK